MPPKLELVPPLIILGALLLVFVMENPKKGPVSNIN